MIATHTAIGIDPAAGHDVIRANQLIEAGLWLHLGGDSEGARKLFTRALTQDPGNRRAREWLAKNEIARAAAPVRPVAVPFASPQPALEVSVVLLDEADAVLEPRLITADVLDFLAEPLDELEAPRPVPPAPAPVSPLAPVRPPVAVAPAPVAPPRTPGPARSPGPAAALQGRALTPLPVLMVRPGPLQEVSTLLQGVEDLLSLGDVSSAMELLRKAEQLAPGDTRVVAASARCALKQQAALEARLGDLKQVPRLKLRMADLMKLSLDARTGFLLSRIDGRLSFEALFAVSGMSRLDTTRVLVQLLDQDIIAVP